MYKEIFVLKKQNQIILLIVFFTISIICRWIITPFDIPLSLDSLQYFLVANDISYDKKFSEFYNKPNLGWPILLSIVFKIIQVVEIIDLMNIQRVISLIFSSATVIPIYFLSKKFFNNKLSIIAATTFIFSPYIIFNSGIGSNDSIFIFFISLFFSLFFSSRKNLILISFFILGLTALFRYEAILLFIPAYGLLYSRLDQYSKKKAYPIALVIGIIPIIVMMLYRFSIGISDGFISNFVSASSLIINEQTIQDEPLESRIYLDRGIFNFLKFSAILFLPISFIFIPYSIVPLIKKEKKFISLVIFAIFLSIPAIYAYSRGFMDIKYVFSLYPALMISSLFIFNKILNITFKKNIVLLIILSATIIFSIIIIDYKKMDHVYLNENTKIAEIISKLDGKINDYGKQSSLVEPLYYINKNHFDNSIWSEREFSIINVKLNSIEDLNRYVVQKDLRFLVVSNENFDENEIFEKIYSNPKAYEFLKIIFDSTQDFQKFKVKIFEIDDEKLKKFMDLYD